MPTGEKSKYNPITQEISVVAQGTRKRHGCISTFSLFLYVHGVDTGKKYPIASIIKTSATNRMP
jgi:hypothetical protein